MLLLRQAKASRRARLWEWQSFHAGPHYGLTMFSRVKPVNGSFFKAGRPVLLGCRMTA